MSKHTKGPWEVDNGNKHRCDHIVAKDGNYIAVIYTGNIADAQLIAAAPDLLQACQDMLKDYGYDSSIREQLTEVINKAGGNHTNN